MNTICQEKMIVYSIIGKVDKESDKIYYWKSFESLFNIINPIICDFKLKKISSKQNWQKFLKQTKEGNFRVTSRKAPTGGELNWNKKNCEKVCTKYLSEAEHLNYAFQNSYKEMMGKYFEKGKEILTFQKHEIYGNINDEEIKYYDIIIRVYPRVNNGIWNQAITVFISQKLINIIGAEKINVMISELSTSCNALKIGKTERKWDELLEMLGETPYINNIMNEFYLANDELELAENKFGEWNEKNFT